MTGPEHYQEAERLARFAEDLYLDNGNDVLTREEYASDSEFHAAVVESNELHEQAIREMAAFSQLAQVHASLAQAAAYGIAPDPPEVVETGELPADGIALSGRTPWGAALAPRLQARPGSWHLIEGHAQATPQLRRRRVDVERGRSGWSPPGDYEARLVQVDDAVCLYARYVGGEGQ